MHTRHINVRPRFSGARTLLDKAPWAALHAPSSRSSVRFSPSVNAASWWQIAFVPCPLWVQAAMASDSHASAKAPALVAHNGGDRSAGDVGDPDASSTGAGHGGTGGDLASLADDSARSGVARRGDVALELLQDFSGSAGAGLGSTLWGSAKAMCALLTGSTVLAAAPSPRHSPLASSPIHSTAPSVTHAALLASGHVHVRDRSVLELGCGVGAVGMVAALHGARQVVVTDRGAVLPLTKHNIMHNVNVLMRNGAALPFVRELDWSDESHATALVDEVARLDDPLEGRLAFDIILCADVAYDVELIHILVATLVRLCKPGSATLVAVVFEHRGGDEEVALATQLRKSGFAVEERALAESTTDGLESSEFGLIVANRVASDD